MVPDQGSVVLCPVVAAVELCDRFRYHPPMIVGQTTMLYYRDLAAARSFYGETLGLRVRFEERWVTLYETTSTSAIGVVGEHASAFHRPQTTNAVMVSLVVDDVDVWAERLRQGGVKILKEPYEHNDVPIRAVLVSDPGGYTVEFFAWTGCA
ncbi:MAG TPA: VOC family protein [Nannocystis exedens]|nr:VOC family protein [Nannocystis exedens]